MNGEKRFALLRIIFGIVWAIDAMLKWTPEIRSHIIDVLTHAQAGQSVWEADWINIWVQVASINPYAFGTLIAVIETMLALSLITGVFSRAALYCGAVFAFLIWSVPQGFGGPYTGGSTDVDSGIVYLLLFMALIMGQAWRSYVLGNRIFKKYL
jgi:thiosulfate dehydrogenase [quinone] large subunit